MAVQVPLVPKETEVLQELWDFRDRKALMVTQESQENKDH